MASQLRAWWNLELVNASCLIQMSNVQVVSRRICNMSLDHPLQLVGYDPSVSRAKAQVSIVTHRLAGPECIQWRD